MNVTEVMNNALALWVAIFHFAVVYIWPTLRTLIIAVAPIAVAAFALGWRPRRRAGMTGATTHD
jgi:hypothetical protein